MHAFLGLTWSEIASIVAIVSAVLAGINYFFKHGVSHVLNPIEVKITQLIESIDSLTNEFKAQKSDIAKLNERIAENEKEIVLHSQKISYIENELKEK